jgi:uroporphyrinogen decarboxylase
MSTFRKDRMTHQERMLALFNYQKPDRVPIFSDIGFSMINCGYTLTEAQTEPHKLWNALQWTSEQYGWDTQWQSAPHTILGSWDFGAKMKMPDNPYAMAVAVEIPAVCEEDDVWNLKMPDAKTVGAIPKRMEFSKLQESAGRPITFFARSPFTMAADICGVQQYSRWILRKPQLCERLLEMALEHNLNVLRYWVDTFGAERIYYIMSSATESNQIFSPKSIQEYAIPYHQKFHQSMRAIGIKHFSFHICGEQNLNLPHLAKLASGADGWPHPSLLSFGHEVDLEIAARSFPDDIIIGNVEPALFSTSSPQQVYERCRMCIEKGKKIRSGFILWSGCALPPRAPAYNVWMMTKAVKDFGWY